MHLTGLTPRPAKQIQEVAGKDAGDVFIGVASRGEKPIESLEIGDAVEVHRALFASEAAIKVAADPDMFCIPRELADVIDVINDVLDLYAGGLWRRNAALPAGDHHPTVEDAADDGVTLDEKFDLLIAELTGIVDQRAAVGVTRPDGAAENFEGLKKGGVTEMGGVEDDPEFIHFANQISTALAESADLVVPVGVAALSIVRGAERAQSCLVGAFEIVWRDDGVGSFEAENVADRFFRGGGGNGGLPLGEVGVEFGHIPDRGHFPHFHHRFVIDALSLGHRPGLRWRFPARAGSRRLHAAADLGGNAEADPAFSHFLESDRVLSTPFHVGLSFFESADFVE